MRADERDAHAPGQPERSAPRPGAGKPPTRASYRPDSHSPVVANPGVVVETAKWGEDEDALIVRLYEADGGDTSTASLALGVRAEAVDQVDLLERNPRALEVPQANDVAVPLEFRAREIKTLLVRVASTPPA